MGDPVILRCELDENQVLSLELRLADDDSADPFKLTIENPLTHVSNPLRERLKIDEREESLRNKEVPADAIPDFITVDLAGTDIGDSIHISAVTLPAGAKPVISDRDFTIATVAGSSAMKPETAEPTAEAGAPAPEAETEAE